MYDGLEGSLAPRVESGHRRPLKIAPLSHWRRSPSWHFYSIHLNWKQEFFSFSEHLIENDCLKALRFVDHSSCLLCLFFKFLKII